MWDRPWGPDEPDEPDDNDDAPDKPREGDHSDQPREHEQPGETDPRTGRPKKWHEFAIDDDFDEDTARAAEQKQIMRAEGPDETILTETFGTDEELGIAAADDGESGDEPEPSGWDDPAVRDNPDRPDLDEIHLPDKRREPGVKTAGVLASGMLVMAGRRRGRPPRRSGCIRCAARPLPPVPTCRQRR